MRSYLKLGSIALVLLSVFTAQAAVLFEDDFLSQEYSTRNWTFVSADDSKLQYIDNAVHIVNNSDNYSALAVHRSSQKTSTFTISAKVSSEYPGSGLYFCFQELRDGYGGYSALLSDNGIYVYKFFPESVSVIAHKVSPFVRMGENMLSVSKENDCISVFCNGFFICNVKDTEFLTGDMALIVPPLSETSFDDVVLEDSYADTLRFATFTDDFLEKSTFGWTKYGNAQVDWKDSQLQIHTGIYQEYYTGIEISLNSFHMKTYVQFNSGDSSSLYGFYIKMANDTGDAPIFYHFAISGNKNFAIRQRGQETELVSHKSISGNSSIIDGSDTATDYDTLEISREQNVFTFYVNGAELEKSALITGNIIGAGLFVSKDLRISFDELQITDLGMQTVLRKTKKREVKVQTIKKDFIAIDLLGRCLFEKFTGVPKIVLRTLDSGMWEKNLKMREGERLR